MIQSKDYENQIDRIKNMFDFIIEKDLFFSEGLSKDFGNLDENLKADQKNN